MKIYISQIYVEVGITYPFSHHFQTWLSDELTNRVRPSPAFIHAYSEEFDLIINMSAKSQIAETEIKGPAVFKRTRDVEFSIFLPHDGRQPQQSEELRRPVQLLLDGVVNVLQQLGMDALQVMKDSPALVEHVVSTPMMISHRTPLPPSGSAEQCEVRTSDEADGVT